MYEWWKCLQVVAVQRIQLRVSSNEHIQSITGDVERYWSSSDRAVGIH